MRVSAFFGAFGPAVCLLGCGHPEKSAEMPQPKVNADSVTFVPNSPQLTALSVERVAGEQAVLVPLSGRLIWDENVTVRVFTPFAGIIRKLYVEVNQPVAKGTPLAEIQSPDFGQAQAEARKAESDLRRAERSMTRTRDLFEHGAAPRKDLDSAEADYAGAQAEQERTETRLAIYGTAASTNQQGFLLPSPLAGVVVEKNVNPGQEVRPDQMLANTPQFTAPLFVISDPTRLWLQIDATELDLPYLRPGCELTLSSRAFPGQTFTGAVEMVSGFVDPATRTIKVRAAVDNPQRLLKAEMFVSLTVPSEAAPGASVPVNAVFLKGDKHYVFTEEQPGQFVRREVQLGPEQGGEILVTAGIHPGQRVVTDGCVLLEQTLQ